MISDVAVIDIIHIHINIIIHIDIIIIIHINIRIVIVWLLDKGSIL